MCLDIKKIGIMETNMNTFVLDVGIDLKIVVDGINAEVV